MVNVTSEIGPLQKVIVHRPDKGISRVSPKKAEELLFDDIVFLPQMQREYDEFIRILKAFVGEKNVLEIQDLLVESLDENPAVKQDLIDRIIEYEELPHDINSQIAGLPADKLAELLITGYWEEEDYFIFDPIPNFIFTRDIAVTVKDYVIITKAAKEARHRENLLTRFVFFAHPMFEEVREQGHLINLNHVDLFPPSRKGERVSIEGGDMMMIQENFLLIGCSERTTEHAIKSLTKVLFEKGVIENVVQINIPSDRSTMHIDTLFTRISETDIVCYKPVVYDGISSNVIVRRRSGDEEIYSSVREFFWAEIHRDMRFIFSGGGQSPYQEREQWTDGCNLVAIRPGVAITYDRNPKTELAFKKKGYSVVHASYLLDQFDNGLLKPEQVKDTIILLSSGELSRARGGSHCMTCPIVRL